MSKTGLTDKECRLRLKGWLVAGLETASAETRSACSMSAWAAHCCASLQKAAPQPPWTRWCPTTPWLKGPQQHRREKQKRRLQSSSPWAHLGKTDSFRHRIGALRGYTCAKHIFCAFCLIVIISHIYKYSCFAEQL